MAIGKFNEVSNEEQARLTEETEQKNNKKIEQELAEPSEVSETTEDEVDEEPRLEDFNKTSEQNLYEFNDEQDIDEEPRLEDFKDGGDKHTEPSEIEKDEVDEEPRLEDFETTKTDVQEKEDKEVRFEQSPTLESYPGAPKSYDAVAGSDQALLTKNKNDVQPEQLETPVINNDVQPQLDSEAKSYDEEKEPEYDDVAKSYDKTVQTETVKSNDNKTEGIESPLLNEGPPGNEIANELNEKSFINNDGKEITYAEAVDEIKDIASKHMEENNVPLETREKVCNDISNELYNQEKFAEARGIGDHGIRHVYENVKRSENYLNSFDNTDTPASVDEHLGCVVSHVYHDHGYMDPDVHDRENGTGDKDHDIRSEKYFSAEKEELYKDVFKNEETVNSVKTAIGEHNTSDESRIKELIGKDSDRVVSSVMVSDKLALTEREKFSDLLSNNSEFVKLTEGMNTLNNTLKNRPELGFYDESGKLTDAGKELQDKYKQGLYDCIDNSNYSAEEKEAYKHAIETDIGLNSGKFSSRMNFVYVPSDCMKVDENGDTVITVNKINYETNNPSLEKVQEGQIKKLYEDLGVEYSEKGKEELKEKGIILNVEEKSIAEIEQLEASKGYDNNDLRTTHENLEKGDAHFKDLNEKLLEVAGVLKGIDIDQAKFLELQRDLKDSNYLYSDLTNNHERQTAVKEMLKNYMSKDVFTIIEKIFDKEDYQ